MLPSAAAGGCPPASVPAAPRGPAWPSPAWPSPAREDGGLATVFDPPVFDPPVIGHRGAAAVAPENTVAAIRAAAAAGVSWVEIDVRLSADRVPVVIHDSTIDRTTNRTGAVAALTAAEIAQADGGGWFDRAFAGEPVPTLAAVLEAVLGLGLRLNIEVKCPPDADAAAAGAVTESALRVTQARWPAAGTPPPLISSFHPGCLMAAAHLAPAWPRGLAMRTPLPDWPELADRLGVSVFALPAAGLTGSTAGSTVSGLRASGRPVLAYTVNRVEEARALFGLGVSAVYSDDPARLLADLRL